MAFFDRFKKTADDWFKEALRVERDNRNAVFEATMRDVERIRQGTLGSEEVGERERVSRELSLRITSCLDKALQLDPLHAPALFAQGEREPYPDEAVRFFDRAIAAKPDFGSAYYCKADRLERKGGLDEALACYERAIELNPNDAEALMGKSRLLSLRGEEKDAALCAEKAVALDPSFGETVRVSQCRWVDLSP